MFLLWPGYCSLFSIKLMYIVCLYGWKFGVTWNFAKFQHCICDLKQAFFHTTILNSWLKLEKESTKNPLCHHETLGVFLGLDMLNNVINCLCIFIHYLISAVSNHLLCWKLFFKVFLIVIEDKKNSRMTICLCIKYLLCGSK